jgi:hypothetical protein
MHPRLLYKAILYIHFVCTLWMHKRKTYLLSRILLFNYKMLPIKLHKLSCMYIHFGKWVVSNRGGSTKAKFGFGRVSHVFSGLFSECLSPIICKFLVGPSRCVMGALHPRTPHVLTADLLIHWYLIFFPIFLWCALKKYTVTETYKSCHDCSIQYLS